DELVELMDKEEAKDVEELLTHPEDSAGGIMTTDFVALPREFTAAQAIDELRAKKPDPQLTYYLYVVDAEGKLEGVLSLRDRRRGPSPRARSPRFDPRVPRRDGARDHHRLRRQRCRRRHDVHLRRRALRLRDDVALAPVNRRSARDPGDVRTYGRGHRQGIV